MSQSKLKAWKTTKLSVYCTALYFLWHGLTVYCKALTITVNVSVCIIQPCTTKVAVCIVQLSTITTEVSVCVLCSAVRLRRRLHIEQCCMITMKVVVRIVHCWMIMMKVAMCVLCNPVWLWQRLCVHCTALYAYDECCCVYCTMCVQCWMIAAKGAVPNCTMLYV